MDFFWKADTPKGIDYACRANTRGIKKLKIPSKGQTRTVALTSRRSLVKRPRGETNSLLRSSWGMKKKKKESAVLAPGWPINPDFFLLQRFFFCLDDSRAQNSFNYHVWKFFFSSKLSLSRAHGAISRNNPAYADRAWITHASFFSPTIFSRFGLRLASLFREVQESVISLFQKFTFFNFLYFFPRTRRE